MFTQFLIRSLNGSRYPERAYPNRARHSERQQNRRVHNGRSKKATPIRQKSRTQLDLKGFCQRILNPEIEKKPAEKLEVVDDKIEEENLQLENLSLEDPESNDASSDGEIESDELEKERTLCKEFCFYNYTSQKALTTFGSKYGAWTILKTKILYCSRDEREVKEYSWEDVEKQKRLEFCVAQLDRNVFEKRFMIQFQFSYNDEPLIYDNEFFIEVSLPFNSLTYYHFNYNLILN